VKGFTCKTCGGHELLVEHEYTLKELYSHSMPCNCGKGKWDLSATYSDWTMTRVIRWGYLDDSHHWDFPPDNVEELDQWTDDEESLAVYCPDCHQHIRDDPDVWPAKITNTREDDERWAMRCAGCRREIPFGWSHPSRVGRIWPVECDDYVEGLSWIEPRWP
jgi:hypothetical protein